MGGYPRVTLEHDPQERNLQIVEMAAAAPPVPPAALPQIISIPVSRMQELVDGAPTDQLRTRDGLGCLQFVRTLRPALMGKVKSAVSCERHADGHWRPRPGSPRFAVKQVCVTSPSLTWYCFR